MALFSSPHTSRCISDVSPPLPAAGKGKGSAKIRELVQGELMA